MIVFPTKVRWASAYNTMVITLGNIEIGFSGNNLMWVNHLTEHESYVYEGLNTNRKPYKYMFEVSQSMLLFHVNRMLHDQAEKLLNKAMDRLIIEGTSDQ